MDLTVEEVFEAYAECRRSKRYSDGAFSFECDYESNLIKLYEELCAGTWCPGPSTCFIVTKPVRREIFASPFRDRIVHHILIRRLNPCLEKYFIKDSYACRKNKGTHAAVSRVEHAVRSVSENGAKEAYVLKIDIKGFFMNISRSLLYEMLETFIDTVYRNFCGGGDVSFEKYLAEKIIFNDCTKDCVRNSPICEWKELPKDKSLFTTKEGCGLPIGNLTSQVFANFYLTPFDHFAKHELGIRHYVRYVDDCVIVHHSRNYLRSLVPVLKNFLFGKLRLALHPKKIYLQPCSNGVQFLGCFIKPSHTVCSRRIKNNFENKMFLFKKISDMRKPSRKELEKMLSSANSYLGILRHYKTWKLRTDIIIRHFSGFLKRHFRVAPSVLKIEMRKKR